ncbi:MAG: NAD-dependent epimerase/dehydratase family protein [Cyanothece sp. SIO1E1]|nr:NAD-dependent epimerase/dehydratase family protein [Cyanothece sp. SIO1E1]
MNVLLTGATGMVGQHVLNFLLQDSKVTSILSIGRRKTGIDNQKLRELVLDNFLKIPELKDELSNINACIHCLGVYQNQVSKEDFFKITCDYQKALTDVLEETSPDLTFCLFGAMGADPTEKSSVRFAKAKGRAENLLMETRFPTKYVFRPGYIKPTGNRQPAGWVYKIAIPLSNIGFKLFPGMGITDSDLAKAMVHLAVNPNLQSQVFENSEIKKLL